MNHLLRSAIAFTKWKQRQYFSFAYLIILSLVLSLQVSASPGAVNDTTTAEQYNGMALKLLNEAKYVESLEMLHLALKKRENSQSYYYICKIQTQRNEWDDAIKNGERAIKLDSTMLIVYPDLFYSYTKVARWKDAKRISEKALKGDSGYYKSIILSIDADLVNVAHSNLTVGLLLLIFAGVFFFPFFRSKNQADHFSEDKMRFSEVLLISASVSCILYSIFYACAHWIWSQNLYIPDNDFAITMRGANFEHDGVESYVMFVMVTANLLITLLATAGLLKLKRNKNIYLPVCIVLLLISGYYFSQTGFFPPEMGFEAPYIFLPIIFAALSFGLFILYRYNSILSKVIVIALIAYVGLVPITAPRPVDFEFILSPALRLYHGFKISEIYFQYDLLLSLLPYAWMKLNLALDWIPYIFVVSFFLFFIGSFFFTDRFFKTKGLSVIFIIALILARLYLISHDTLLTPQVTPMRLDLWIILLLIAGYKGVHHWLLGVFVGLLVLFHRNLGLLYLTAYFELLVVLFIIDVVSLVQEKNISTKTLSDLFVKHLRLNAKNIAIIIASTALCFILFKEMFSASALVYRKIGINFLPVYKQSFYWYFPVILGCLFVFLLYFRKRLGEKYTATGLFIVLLAIANSMYFFGRSHENNILNLSGILVLTLFVLFDVLIFQSPQVDTQPAKINTAVPPKTQNKNVQAKKPEQKSTSSIWSYLSERNAYLFLSVLVVFLMGYYYSGRVYGKMEVQYANLIESNFAPPFVFNSFDTTAVKQVTYNSHKVYFMDEEYDFFYCYYGKDVPQGYYSPFCSYVLKKDIINFEQGLLDKGYYIVYDNKNLNHFTEYLPYLKYNQSYQKNDVVALKKEDVPHLLPDDPASLLHLSIKDSLANPGLDYNPLTINEDLTLEVIVKPIGIQLTNAGILNNLSQFDNEGLKGFAFQLNSNVQNQYIIAFCNGTAAVPNIIFNMESNVWHYLAATVNKQMLKVYDNGRLVSAVSFGGQSFVNSVLPVIIGNRQPRDCHFHGYIREVKISNGNMSEADIISTGQKISAQLNTPNH